MAKKSYKEFTPKVRITITDIDDPEKPFGTRSKSFEINWLSFEKVISLFNRKISGELLKRQMMREYHVKRKVTLEIPDDYIQKNYDLQPKEESSQ